MKKKILPILLCVGLALGLSACGGEGVEAPSPAPVETASPTATPTASPEATATPTPTPSPTAKPSPEASPEATAEPTPTAKATPAPTPKAETTPKPKADNKDNSNENLNLSQNAVVPTAPPEEVTIQEYFEEVGVDENVTGAGQPRQFDYEFEDPETGTGESINQTGEEMFNQIEQWAKEGF